VVCQRPGWAVGAGRVQDGRCHFDCCGSNMVAATSVPSTYWRRTDGPTVQVRHQHQRPVAGMGPRERIEKATSGIPARAPSRAWLGVPDRNVPADRHGRLEPQLKRNSHPRNST
jgi:hypothetical protein